LNKKEIIIPDILFCYPEEDIENFRELIDFVFLMENKFTMEIQ
jgi:hypothetical protein